VIHASTMSALEHLPKDRPLEIFLVHGSHTGGHRAAAEAVKHALDGLPNVHAEVIDSLDYTPARDAQVGVTDLFIHQLTDIRGWAFREQYERNPVIYWMSNQGMKAKAWMSGDLGERLQHADAILSCHSPMSSMLGYWKEEGELDPPLHSVVTDFRAHRMWAQDAVEHYYVASDQVKSDLTGFEVPAGRIEVTGIPVDPRFSTLQPGKEDARRAMQLDPAMPTVVMMGGSLGLGPFADTARALAASTTPMQMVCITGRNEKKRKDLEALAKTLPMPMTVLGYTKDVQPWIDAADVVVSKPGGLTTSEIFARRVPMVILEPMPGLEELVAPAIVSTGAALQVKGPTEAAAAVESLLHDPSLRQEVQRCLDRVSHPDAADVIAEHLVEDALRYRQAHQP